VLVVGDPPAPPPERDSPRVGGTRGDIESATACSSIYVSAYFQTYKGASLKTYMSAYLRGAGG
jgi:hypothetical protein